MLTPLILPVSGSSIWTLKQKLDTLGFKLRFNGWMEHRWVGYWAYYQLERNMPKSKNIMRVRKGFLSDISCCFFSSLSLYKKLIKSSNWEPINSTNQYGWILHIMLRMRYVFPQSKSFISLSISALNGEKEHPSEIFTLSP